MEDTIVPRGGVGTRSSCPGGIGSNYIIKTDREIDDASSNSNNQFESTIKNVDYTSDVSISQNIGSSHAISTKERQDVHSASDAHLYAPDREGALQCSVLTRRSKW